MTKEVFAYPDIRAPRWQPVHEHQVDEEIKVACHRLAGYAETGGQLSALQEMTAASPRMGTAAA